MIFVQQVWIVSIIPFSLCWNLIGFPSLIGFLKRYFHSVNLVRCVLCKGIFYLQYAWSCWGRISVCATHANNISESWEPAGNADSQALAQNNWIRNPKCGPSNLCLTVSPGDSIAAMDVDFFFQRIFPLEFHLPYLLHWCFRMLRNRLCLRFWMKTSHISKLW